MEALPLNESQKATLSDFIPLSSNAPLLRQSFTPKQGQYLAFISAYTRVLGRPPAEADLQAALRRGHTARREFMDMLQQISTCTSIVEEAPLLQKAPLIGAAPTGSQQDATATCKSATARPCVGS